MGSVSIPLESVQPAAFDPQQIARLLPLLRIDRGRVLALYADALITGRLEPSAHITEEMCAPDGRARLLAVLKDPRETPFTAIRSVQMIAPHSPFENSGSRFQVETDAGSILFHLKGGAAVHFQLVLEQLLPGRVRQRASIWRRLNWRVLGVFYLIANGLAIPASLLLATTPDNPWGLAALFIIAFFIVALVVYFNYIWLYRTKKPTRDRSGGWAYHNRPLGWVLKILGLGLLGVALLAGPSSGSSGSSARDISNLLFMVGGAAMILGYQMSLLEPRLADRDPGSHPIFYLRAFDDDNRTNLQPGGLQAMLHGLPSGDMLTSRSQSLVYLYPIRLVRMFFNLGVETAEEQLARFFHKHGPFLAIGKPGETFSAPGALRIYVRDDKWQAMVLEILARCKAVVLQPARSRGIWWEVEQVLALVAPQRILMCLVNFKGRPDDYEQFRLRIEPLLPVTLPRVVPYLDRPAFLYFETDWTPRLQLLNYRSPFLWGLTGDATDMNTTLAPFMQGVEGQPRPLPIPPKAYRLQKGIVTALLLALNALVIFLVLATFGG